MRNDANACDSLLVYTEFNGDGAEQQQRNTICDRESCVNSSHFPCPEFGKLEQGMREASALTRTPGDKLAAEMFGKTRTSRLLSSYEDSRSM